MTDQCVWPTRHHRCRPKSLSDPYRDFTPELLRELLLCPDDELTCWHFSKFLAPHLPAGTYHETVYFLPLLFDHLHRHAEDGLDLAECAVAFVAKHHEALSEDGILDRAQECLWRCLKDWTSTFEVVAFERQSCRNGDKSLAYIEYLKNSEAICEMLTCLSKWKQNIHLAERFAYELVHSDRNDTQICWHLYLAASYSQVYHPPADPSIREVLLHRDALSFGAGYVRKTPHLFDISPAIWKRIFAELAV